MNNLMNVKVHQFLAPIDANGTTVTDIECDTAGFHSLMIIAQLGVISANMTALKFQHRNDSSVSDEADITGATWSTIPTAAGGDGDTLVGMIDLRGKKRYISMVATAGADVTLFAVVGILFRADVTPASYGSVVDQTFHVAAT